MSDAQNKREGGGDGGRERNATCHHTVRTYKRKEMEVGEL